MHTPLLGLLLALLACRADTANNTLGSPVVRVFYSGVRGPLASWAYLSPTTTTSLTGTKTRLSRVVARGAGTGSMRMSGSYNVDVAVIGSGPAGAAMAALLSEQMKLKTVVIDPNLDKRWLPNYGVWLEEWEALEKSLGFSVVPCLMKTWEVTDLFCGGSHGIPLNERLRVDRPYGRVDRAKLKAEFRGRAERGGAVMLKSKVDTKSVKHDAQGSSFSCDDGSSIRARMIVDCSGFSWALVEKEGKDEPGVQVAYGIDCVCDTCPYDEAAMTLMDYRTDYFPNAEQESGGNREPTFMYAMPMGTTKDGKKKVFFEETSLVARPPMTFDECKHRMKLRLEHLGVKVLEVEEEEFCYIPMGGALPKLDQRVVAFGGSLGLVHPSTGYNICRTLAAAGPVARSIAAELRKPDFQPDKAARAVYRTSWTQKTRLQRDFMVFGGDFLMAQDAANLRGFFDSFFRLPVEYWSGFLAGWPGLPNNEYHETWEKRLLFGLQLFLLAPLPLKIGLAYAGVTNGGLPFFRSVTPLSLIPLEGTAEEP